MDSSLHFFLCCTIFSLHLSLWDIRHSFVSPFPSACILDFFPGLAVTFFPFRCLGTLR
ncbi:hypothetical protein EDD85DRAFT_833641 [Armillaria nabsnona]|nr:hypothetical protein EDD85DRAFT_833641 [Armillaria nabsnona]